MRSDFPKGNGGEGETSPRLRKVGTDPDKRVGRAIYNDRSMQPRDDRAKDGKPVRPGQFNTK